MDIKAASVDEIAEFKTAAAQRYQELGVPPQVADQLFNAAMGKIAEALGSEAPQAPQAARMDKVAELLSDKIARKRAAAKA